MNETKRPVNEHDNYHAHVYYDQETKAAAKQVYEATAENFDLSLGTFLEKLVGPHPRWSFQVIFSSQDFDSYLRWLDENRQGLTVFVHALTGDDMKDHTELATWLGDEVELNLAFFERLAAARALEK